MSLELGKAAKELRTRLKLSLRAAAAELGMSYTHLCNVENGKISLTSETLERFHDAWGVDLYMFALAYLDKPRGNSDKSQAALSALLQEWKKHVDCIIEERVETKKPSLISNE